MITKNYKKGDLYCKFEGAEKVEISQEEKDELDALEIAHQGSCPDFQSMIAVAKLVDDVKATTKFDMAYVNTSDENKTHEVDLT